MTHRIDGKRARLTGFTLVELLVVLVILSILASIGLPLAELGYRRHREEELRLALRQIRDGIDAYKKAVDTGRIIKQADQSGYPPQLNVLVEGVTDATDPARGKLYFLRRLPRDPFAADPQEPPELTWAKRSYASEPNEPREGRDVYDVYSRSSDVGINGLPYRQW